MKIEATAKDIRALLELMEAEKDADQRLSEARRQSREALARRVPRHLLDRYQVLLEIRRTPVVAAMEQGACSGCHVRLPTMVEHMVRRTLAIHTCPHCRRMLYAPELIREESQRDAQASRRAAPASASKT